MAHLMGAQYRNPGQPPIQRDWIRYANSGSLKFEAVGSGAAIATVMTGGGYVKALDFAEYNTPAFILRDNAATLVAFGSGAVGAQRFQPCWFKFDNTLTVSKSTGTAESAWGILTSTSSIEDPAVGLA